MKPVQVLGLTAIGVVLAIQSAPWWIVVLFVALVLVALL